MAPQKAAYCTLLTNDDYVNGALVLAQSLRNQKVKWPLCALVVPESVSKDSKKALKTLYDEVIVVPEISGLSKDNLRMIGRPDLHATLTKLNVWSLSQYDRMLYLDADTLALASLDHLFTLPDSIHFAASPELGFPDCFNGGVMLITPNKDTFDELTTFATKVDSFDGGDQGLLNIYFGDGTLGHSSYQEFNTNESAPKTAETNRPWYRLSYTCNIEIHKVYRLYISAVLRYQTEHKVIHFIRNIKPWHFPDGHVNETEDASEYFKFYRAMVQKWWEVNRQLQS